MSDRLPFFLSDAQISLYRADAAGRPLGAAVWLGGFANRLRVGFDFEEVVVRGSGDAYGAAHHVDESHVLTFGQTWLIPTATLTDWTPGRNVTYVLVLTWQVRHVWYRRTYYGVTWRSLHLDAGNPNQFLTDQVVRAQNFVADSGSAALGQPLPPTVLPAPAPLVPQPVGFFREAPLIAGEYLLGFYAWPTAVTLADARVIAWAPQTAPVVLELEVNGALTGQTLTLQVGDANTEVTAAGDLAGVVPAGQTVRWKIVHAPDPADTAWNCMVQLRVAGG